MLFAACRVGGSAPPAFEDGDVIFQESTSRQSDMVRVLTRSRWTHVSVVFNDCG
jgi:hypothetical protein